MSLAVPSALAFALIAIPIIVFYILKVRLRQVPVSTNMFWKQIFDEKPPRSIWERFRHLLSLLAQLLMLALMVFALADPLFSWQALQAKRIVLVIDNSASMKATDVEPTRFQAAIDRAVELADGLRFRDEMAIVLAGSRPDVVLGMSGHVPTLKESLRGIEVSDNPTRLDSAIELGKQLIGDYKNGEVIVLTDGCAQSARETADEISDASTDESASETIPEALAPETTTDLAVDDSPSLDDSPSVNDSQSSEPDDSPESNTKISWQIFATQASNVGITQFQVRRSLVDMLGYEVLASVKNATEKNLKCRLEISLDDSVVDVIPLELEPGELMSRSLEKTSRKGGILSARLTKIQDAEKEENKDTEVDAKESSTQADEAAPLNSLQADDSAWAILPEQKVQNVLIVTEGNLFLRKVFEANPLVNVTTVTEMPKAFPANTLIVLHRRVPKVIPPGDVFVVDPIEDCDQWTIGETIANPIVTEINKKSDLMTHVRLDNVVLPEARSIDFASELQILAGTISQEPVYAEIKRASGKCLLLSVDLDKSDLAFRTTFPIMVTNALNWFVESSGDLRESSATGDLVSWPVDLKPLAGKSLILQNPAGEDSTIATFGADTDSNQAANNDSLTLGPFESSGIWALGKQALPTSIKASEEPPIELITNFAVNIANERETDLRPTEAMLAMSSETSSFSSWFGKPVWYYLIATALVLLVAEWMLHQRRVLS